MLHEEHKPDDGTPFFGLMTAVGAIYFLGSVY
jgi:hypothetical protein